MFSRICSVRNWVISHRRFIYSVRNCVISHRRIIYSVRNWIISHRRFIYSVRNWIISHRRYFYHTFLYHFSLTFSQFVFDENEISYSLFYLNHKIKYILHILTFRVSSEYYIHLSLKEYCSLR